MACAFFDEHIIGIKAIAVPFLLHELDEIEERKSEILR